MLQRKISRPDRISHLDFGSKNRRLVGSRIDRTVATAGSQNHIAQAVTLNQLAASCIFILRKGEHFTYQVEFLVIDLKYIRLFQQTGDQLLRVVRLGGY